VREVRYVKVIPRVHGNHTLLGDLRPADHCTLLGETELNFCPPRSPRAPTWAASRSELAGRRRKSPPTGARERLSVPGAPRECQSETGSSWPLIWSWAIGIGSDWTSSSASRSVSGGSRVMPPKLNAGGAGAEPALSAFCFWVANNSRWRRIVS